MLKQKHSIAELAYISNRLVTAKIQSILFYLFRIFPINNKKIVCCALEGTAGYICNPKYITEELIRRGKDYEIIWLTDDENKVFPEEVKAERNTLIKRAYHLTTARIWIDNSRKQLEVRKRKGQFYIQTWHGRIGFKPTGLDRGESFSEMAYMVSKHDSDMIDCFLTNSEWFTEKLERGMLYSGRTLKSGSPRCDILINSIRAESDKKKILYAPTFRGGNDKGRRDVDASTDHPDMSMVVKALGTRFGGEWNVLLRLHPQLTARGKGIYISENTETIIDVSREDDIYEILSGCNALITDYSSIAFDASAMRIPVFIYAPDIEEYENTRGSLYWKREDLPFPVAKDNEGLKGMIEKFDENMYRKQLDKMYRKTGMIEDGHGSEKVAELIEDVIGETE